MPKNLEAKISAAAKKLIFEAKYGDIVRLWLRKQCYFEIEHETPEYVRAKAVLGNPSEPIFPGSETIIGEFNYYKLPKNRRPGSLSLVIAWDCSNDPSFSIEVPLNIIKSYTIVGYSSGASS